MLKYLAAQLKKLGGWFDRSCHRQFYYRGSTAETTINERGEKQKKATTFETNDPEDPVAKAAGEKLLKIHDELWERFKKRFEEEP